MNTSGLANSVLNQHWIPIEKVEALIPLESFVVVGALIACAWILYRIFLRGVSTNRHNILRFRYFRILIYFVLSVLLGALYWTIRESVPAPSVWTKASSYFGLLALIFAGVTLMRLSQFYLYLYLFLGNMKVGVPRLVVNLFTLVFATVIFGWIASDVFGIQLAPLLATSAIFSIILGLALQDTLGNLFSGVALQLDKPYGIGDWIEIQNGAQKWIGQIHEITWRATLLIAFTDEMISIPNRTMAQSQVLIFSRLQKPPLRSLPFRFPLDVSISAAKGALLRGIDGVSGILADPAPSILITETTESWITFKVIYSVADFGTQFRIGDQLITQILEEVRKAGLKLASPVVKLEQSSH